MHAYTVIVNKHFEKVLRSKNVLAPVFMRSIFYYLKIMNDYSRTELLKSIALLSLYWHKDLINAKCNYSVKSSGVELFLVKDLDIFGGEVQTSRRG